MNQYAAELISLVQASHPAALFLVPNYWPDEQLWLIDAFFDQGEDFTLQERLSERETDILLDHGLWFCVLLLPLADYPHQAASLPTTNP
jgi:hypothetical protein